MPGRDRLDFNVNVDSAAGQASLNALLRKVRELGNTAVAEGGKVDASVNKNAASYRKLATDVAAVNKLEEQALRANEATRASIARSRASASTATSRAATAASNATTSKVSAIAAPALANNKIDLGSAKIQTEFARASALAREQENRNLIAQGRLLLNNGKIDQINEARNRAAARDEQANFTRRMANTRTLARAETAAYAEQNARNRAVQFGDAGDPAKLNATRNALYGAASAAAVAGTALVAFGAYSTASAAQFESSFANVQRAAELTVDNVDEIRSELIDLSTTLPTSFTELADIATLGAQMGIAADDLDKFSSVVAKFSATTNVTSEQAGTSFGRISNLLDVDPADFDKLGAAIYQVGIKSVATESEILSMSQQIAGAAATYKISAQDVVGMSAAFASLAIAPEAARGSVTRIFSKINSATREGGQKLQAYADIMQMTSEDTAKLFKQDPSAFFQKLVTGLSKTEDLAGAISSIGAGDVRDQNLLQRLAGNPDILIKSIDTANQAYTEGTALNAGYAVTLDTLVAKLKIFANSFKALAAQAGGPVIAVLAPVLELLTRVVNFLASNPIAAGFIGMATGISLLVGAFLLLKAAQAAAIAGLISIRTALDGLATSGGRATVSMATLRTQLIAVGTAATGSGAAVGGAAGKFALFRGAAGAIGGAIAPLLIIAALAASAQIAIDGLHDAFDSAATKSEPYIGTLDGIGDALAKDTQAHKDGAPAIATFASSFDSSKGSTDDAAKSASALADVLNNELPEAANASSKAAEGSVIAWGAASTAYVKAQLGANDKFKELAANNDFAKAFKLIGANTDDAIAAAAKDGTKGINKYFDDLQKEYDKRNGLGPVKGGATGWESLSDGLFKSDNIEEYKKALAGVREDTQAVINANDILGTSTDGSSDSLKKQQLAAQAAGSGLDDYASGADGATDKVSKLKDEMDSLFSNVNAASDFGSSIQALFSGIYDGGTAFDNLSDAGRTNLSNLQDAITQTVQYAQSIGANAQTSVGQLFTSLQQQGVDTASLLQQLGANPYTFYATLDVTDVQRKLAAIGQQFNSGDYGGAFSGLGSAVAQMANEIVDTALPTTSGLNINLQNLAASAPKAASSLGGSGGGGGGTPSVKKAAKEAAEEIYTLSDYVSDLGGILDKSYEFRFGVGEANNDLNKQWRDIRDAQQESNDKIKDQVKDIKDSRRELAGYRADLKGLQANLSQDKYFLKVANRFGDALRGQQIGADIAKDKSDINDKNADIAAAKTEINAKKNELSSLRVQKSIADQDEALGGLVKSYNDLITQYANSGLSSEQLKDKVVKLKDQFVKQATQAGYSRTEIRKYAGAFDDMRQAIRKLPKKVTVDTYSNTSPANRALKEFIKKANKSNATPSVGAGTSGAAARNGAAAGRAFGGSFGSELQRKATEAVLNVSLQAVSSLANINFGGKAKGGFAGEPGFATGGFVPGMKPQDRSKDNVVGYMASGGIVGLQGGEPISTNAARNKYGDAMFEQINALKFRPEINMMVQQQASTSGEVIAHLSASDRALLRAALNRPVEAKVSYVDTARAAAKGNAALTFGG